jgi:hypothetical protein
MPSFLNINRQRMHQMDEAHPHGHAGEQALFGGNNNVLNQLSTSNLQQEPTLEQLSDQVLQNVNYTVHQPSPSLSNPDGASQSNHESSASQNNQGSSANQSASNNSQ